MKFGRGFHSVGRLLVFGLPLFAATNPPVADRANDAYATYLDLGSPAQLTRAQVARIKADNSGAPFAKADSKVGRDGKFQQRFDLREKGVCLVLLTRR